MKKLYPFLASVALCASVSLSAQTYHSVTVSNLAFTPQNLEINAGDTVLWTNIEGQHSVVGNTVDFPNNPESFGNAIGPAGWTYEFIFDLPGEYNYKCGVHTAMTGSIVVSEGTGISEIETGDQFMIFPNPVTNQLSWKWNENTPLPNAVLTFYDVHGKLVDKFSVNHISTYDVSRFSEGIYTFSLQSKNEIVQSGKVLIVR